MKLFINIMEFGTDRLVLECGNSGYIVKKVCIYITEVVMFVSLGLSYHSRIFHSYGDVNITGEGLEISTYARHSWPLSSEGSLACNTYCDTEHPFIMVRGPVTLTPIAERLAVELSLPVFTT